MRFLNLIFGCAALLGPIFSSASESDASKHLTYVGYQNFSDGGSLPLLGYRY